MATRADEVILDNFDEIPEFDEVVLPEGEKIIAEDDFFKLTPGRLEIKNYFFPSKKSRYINLKEIKAIWYKNQCKTDILTTRIWGMHGMKVWWSHDLRRCIRGMQQTMFCNVVIDCGERTMKGFTVSNLDKFRRGMEQITTEITYIRDKLPDIF